MHKRFPFNAFPSSPFASAQDGDNDDDDNGNDDIDNVVCWSLSTIICSQTDRIMSLWFRIEKKNTEKTSIQSFTFPRAREWAKWVDVWHLRKFMTSALGFLRARVRKLGICKDIAPACRHCRRPPHLHFSIACHQNHEACIRFRPMDEKLCIHIPFKTFPLTVTCYTN